jgi:hypothetical protein
MSTLRQEGTMSFAAQFPIVANNLRSLVSSWLPPAREPSPEEEENAENQDFDARQERHEHCSS